MSSFWKKIWTQRELPPILIIYLPVKIGRRIQKLIFLVNAPHLPKGPKHNPQTDLTLRLESLWVYSLNAENPGAFVVPFVAWNEQWNNGWVECSSIFLLIKLIFFFLLSNSKSVHDPRSFAHWIFLAITSYCRFWGHWWRNLSWVAMDWQ